MKDYIEVYDENDNYQIMEAVCTFKLKKYENNNYIIYTELDKSHYYLAKYDNDDISNLNTDFDDDEFDLAFNVFKEVVK